MEQDFNLPPEIGPYKLVKKLGVGKQSILALYDLQIMSKTQFIKIFKISNFQNQSEYTEFVGNLQQFMNLDHPNINFYDDIFDDSENLYLASKYFEKGNIGEYIFKNGPFQESASRLIFRQLLSAIQFLHERQFAHCDIKPEHILIDNDMKVVITDFEYAVKRGDKRPRKSKSTLYSAPETASQHYDLFASDMWSLGVILYFILTGNTPWNPSDPRKTIEEQKQMISLTPLANASPVCNDLIKHLIDPDPSNRYAYEDIITHPWLSQNKRLNAFLSESSPMLLRSNKSFQLSAESTIKPRNSDVLRQSSDQSRQKRHKQLKPSLLTFM